MVPRGARRARDRRCRRRRCSVRSRRRESARDPGAADGRCATESIGCATIFRCERDEAVDACAVDIHERDTLCRCWLIEGRRVAGDCEGTRCGRGSAEGGCQARARESVRGEARGQGGGRA